MTGGKAIIFDMDGVIVDSNPFHKIALKQFAHAHGYDLSEELLREKIYGRTNKDWLTNLFGTLTAQQVNQYGEEKEKMYRDLHRKDIRPVDGLIPFLEALDRHRIPRAIATSAPPSNVEFALGSTGTNRFFTIILDETFITHSKPHPEIYQKAVAALKLAPSQCIVIEDSLSGVRAGKAAGCRVVGITTTHSADELCETDFVIDDFTELDPLEMFELVFRDKND
jgi:beta-phosphoglucomutase